MMVWLCAPIVSIVNTFYPEIPFYLNVPIQHELPYQWLILTVEFAVAGEQIDNLQRLVEKYKFHIEHLEMAWDMLFEDEIQISDFNEIQEDVDYFIENNQEEEMEYFDDTYIYEMLKQKRGHKPKPEPVASLAELVESDAVTDSNDAKNDDGDDHSRHGSSKDRKQLDKKDKRKSDKEHGKKNKKDKSKPAPPIQISANYQPAPTNTKHSRQSSFHSDSASSNTSSITPVVPKVIILFFWNHHRLLLIQFVLCCVS